MNSCDTCKWDNNEECPCAYCSEDGNRWEPKEEHIDKIGIYDVVEEYRNATVQILRNSVTGEETFGWYDNDNPPAIID